MRKLLFLRVGEKFRLLHTFLAVLYHNAVIVFVHRLAEDVIRRAGARKGIVAVRFLYAVFYFVQNRL